MLDQVSWLYPSTSSFPLSKRGLGKVRSKPAYGNLAELSSSSLEIGEEFYHSFLAFEIQIALPRTSER